MFTIDFLKSVLNVSVFGEKNGFAEGFSVHSGQIKKGDCFVGLPGVSCDGGVFWREALANGACGLLLHQAFYDDYIMSKDDYPHSWAFFVDDTKKALLQIAKKWRSLFDLPIIAVTGSVGKTTTKEMLRSIFNEAGYSVCATENSQNGSIGLPLSILLLRKNHQIAIFEVGVQKPGEMDILIEILKSVTYSIVTTILESHIEYFQDISNIIKEKTKLQYITSDGFFIDYNFKKYVQHKNIISIGTHDNANFCYQSLSTQVIIDISEKNKQFVINAGYHEGLRHCLVVAFAVAFVFMIKPKKIIYALENFERVIGRFSVHHLKSGGIIINDCFNAAHPVVMLTAINAFEVFPVFKKKILILGDMLEQGDNKYRNHEIIIERVNAIPESVVEEVYYVGEAFSYNASKNKRNNVFFFSSFLEINEQVYLLLKEKCCVLFKSSRGMLFFNYVSDYLEKINKE